MLHYAIVLVVKDRHQWLAALYVKRLFVWV